MPFVPQAGKGQYRAGARGNIIGLLADRRRLPLVIARRRDDAAAFPEGIAKHWPAGDRLRQRVEGRGQFLERLLPPLRSTFATRTRDSFQIGSETTWSSARATGNRPSMRSARAGRNGSARRNRPAA